MTKRTSSAARRAAAVALAMIGSSWLCGCGSSVESFCEDMCDCQGCSDAELQDCIEDGEESEAEMEERGCGEQFEDYLDCLDDSFDCVDGEAEFDESCVGELMSCSSIEYD